MSWADSRLEDNVHLYEMHTKLSDGTEEVRYAYGEPWVMQALLMDDLWFVSPEAAKAWWEEKWKLK